MTFQELNLSKPILRAVARAGYEKPSPIQAGAIPPVLNGQDLMGCAQTGTGKTAAFALPMLDLLSARPPKKPGAIRALILTPTRELALQIEASFEQYGQYLKLRPAVIFGGVGQAPQVEKLKQGVDILVACPGRLNDLIGQGYVDLSGIEIFVLDEADRMLDMGFVHDVKRVIAKLPVRRQTLMFSATMPAEIEQLAAGILRDPAFVKVDPVSSTVDRIEQSLYFVSKADKRKLLPWLIQNLQPPVHNALVFSRTKHGADRIAKDLARQGIPAAAIHGNKSQSARVAALEGFKAGRTKVLVATDIAARGIDISELSHVFNYDLPEVPETYVHRIGRTARAGADGVAYTAAQQGLFGRAFEALRAAGQEPALVHCDNSAGPLLHPDWPAGLPRARCMGRPGIILYGYPPSHDVPCPGLRPVMAMKTVVSMVKELQPGQSASYGRRFTAKAPTLAATLCAGYADGYPRLPSEGKGVVDIHGVPCPVLGRVCMDQMLVDVTAVPQTAEGDTAVLWGGGTAGDTAESIALKTGTISYEVLCGVARRVPRVYLEQGQAVAVDDHLTR